MMPFTLSHPALVIPLFRKAKEPIAIVALIVGSVIPDLGYYLRVFSLATYAHSLAGSVLICIPSGLAVLGALLLIRQPFCFLLPTPHRQAVFDSLCGGRITVGVAFWIWVGATTPIFWDAFTHQKGWFVTRIEPLRSMHFTLHDMELSLYYLLQHGSTIVGGMIVVVFYSRWIIRYCDPSHSWFHDLWRYALWAGMIFLSLILGMWMSMDKLSEYQGFLAVRAFVFQSAISAGAIFSIILICAVSITWIFFRDTFRGEPFGG